MDNELFEKIKYCVSFDLIGNGKYILPDKMTVVDKIRYQKQSDRLYYSCVCSPIDKEYIEDRYDGIRLYK